MPEVSVIIPTYNSASYLIEAIESVLAQTYQDFEILVIDDGSTDETSEVLNRFNGRLTYVTQANSGVAHARNRGIEMSKGRYIAFLDADDTWFPEKLARQINALQNQPDCHASSTGYVRTRSDLSHLWEHRLRPERPALVALLKQGTVFFISTVICERSLFEKSGRFDPSLSQCADWDMWIRLARQTEFAYIDEPLATYRQHERNMSRDSRLLERDSLNVLQKTFADPLLPVHLKGIRRQVFARNFRVLAGTYFNAGRYADSGRCAFRSLSLDFREIGPFLRSFNRVVKRPL